MSCLGRPNQVEKASCDDFYLDVTAACIDLQEGGSMMKRADLPPLDVNPDLLSRLKVRQHNYCADDSQ